MEQTRRVALRRVWLEIVCGGNEGIAPVRKPYIDRIRLDRRLRTFEGNKTRARA